MPTYIPQISLRRTKKLPFETFKKILDFERKDPHKRIAFVNDEGKMHSMLHRLKFPYEVACSYSTVGCNETAFPGGMVGGTTNANALRSMDNTFKNHRDELIAAKSFFPVKRTLCPKYKSLYLPSSSRNTQPVQ